MGCLDDVGERQAGECIVARFAQISAAFFLVIVADQTLSQENPGKSLEIPAPTLEPLIFNAAGKEIWHRPPEVKHVLITACGGGGSGADHQRISTSGPAPSNYIAGKGGSSAPIETLIVKVDAEKYEITIGNGGERTVFAWDGGQIAFVPGETGGRPDGNGAASAMGTGGGPPSQMYNRSFNGNPGLGNCAGGGGSGLYSLGGKGAPGYLAIVPLPDLNRFARVLGIIESLAGSPESPPIGDQVEVAPTSEGAEQ